MRIWRFQDIKLVLNERILEEQGQSIRYFQHRILAAPGELIKIRKVKFEEKIL